MYARNWFDEWYSRVSVAFSRAAWPHTDYSERTPVQLVADLNEAWDRIRALEIELQVQKAQRQARREREFWHGLATLAALVTAVASLIKALGH